MEEKIKKSPKENIKEKILQAAVEEFAEFGFKGARVERIAEKANLNKAMLYYYFGNKEELYKASLEFVIRKIKSDFRKYERKSFSTAKEFVEYLIEILFRIHFNIEYSSYSSLIIKDMVFGKKHISPIIRDEILPIIEEVILEATSIFRKENISELDPILLVIFISLIITSIEFRTKFIESPLLKSLIREKDREYIKNQIKKIFVRVIDCYVKDEDKTS